MRGGFIIFSTCIRSVCELKTVDLPNSGCLFGNIWPVSKVSFVFSSPQPANDNFDAVLHCFDYLAAKEGFEVTHLPVNREGRVSPDDLAKAIRPDTTLVSIQAANNEIGTIQPVAELGALCRQRGVLFHTDAVQWFGKEPFADIHQFNADLVSVCAHKFHGPKGAGLLFIRSPLLARPNLVRRRARK